MLVKTRVSKTCVKYIKVYYPEFFHLHYNANVYVSRAMNFRGGLIFVKIDHDALFSI